MGDFRKKMLKIDVNTDRHMAITKAHYPLASGAKKKNYTQVI